jgi:sortase A
VKRSWSALPALAVVLLASCGGSGSSAPTTVASTEVAPSTTVAVTDSAPTTSPATLDSLAAADTSLPADDSLPAPVAPPPPESSEPKNQIGSIELPTLHVKEYMFEGVTMPTLNRGPGHWPGSAMPGHTGNMVVAGHRVSHTHPFRDLDKLRPGDPVVFTVGAGRYVYLVDHTKIVSPYDLYILDQTPDKTATLFACHPKGSTKQRIVVFLKYSPSQSQPAV